MLDPMTMSAQGILSHLRQSHNRPMCIKYFSHFARQVEKEIQSLRVSQLQNKDLNLVLLFLSQVNSTLQTLIHGSTR